LPKDSYPSIQVLIWQRMAGRGNHNLLITSTTP